MKRLIKAYTLPVLVLVAGGGVYYLVFSKSASLHFSTTTAATNVENPTSDTAHTSPTRLAATNLTTTNSATTNPTPESTPTLESTSPIAHNQKQEAQQEIAQQQTPKQELPAQEPTTQTEQATQIAQTTQTTPTQKPDTQEARIYYSKATHLNIRAIPKTTGRILGRLTLGERVVVRNIADDWAELDSGGWVSLGLLSQEPLPQKLYIVIPKTLNIRANPESNAPIIGALYKDQQVQVANTQDDWAELDSGGWVSLRLIRAI